MFFLALAMATALCASAQMTKLKEFGYFTPIPSILTADGKLQIQRYDGEAFKNDRTSLDLEIYDADFNKQKSVNLNFPTYSGYTLTEERDLVVSVSETESELFVYRQLDYAKNRSTSEYSSGSSTEPEAVKISWEEAKQYAAAYFYDMYEGLVDSYLHTGNTVEVDGDWEYHWEVVNKLGREVTDLSNIIADESTHSIIASDTYVYSYYGHPTGPSGRNHYYEYKSLGNKYPSTTFVYNTTEQSLYKVSTSYNGSRTGSWKSTKSNEYEQVVKAEVSFCDYDKDNVSDNLWLYVTQTLFNEDANYEYLMPIVEVLPSSSYTQDKDGDGEIDYKDTSYRPEIVGFKIVSETGSVLQEIKLNGTAYYFTDFALNVYKINNKFYAQVTCGSEEESFVDLYRIDPTSTSVKLMENERRSVRIQPTVADRGSMITVELDDTDVARELVVTSIDGRIVERRAIPAGEKQIRVPAAGMASGMYNFTIRKRGSVQENGKVIVK